MILTAHQPVYLPWLGLFDKIAQADTFVLFDKVQYCPKDYNNRNQIWTPDGPQWLTVPVYTNGHRLKTIDQIEINNTLPWQRKHWKTIEQSYRKAKYWDKYKGFAECFYLIGHYDNFSLLNSEMLEWLLVDLDIKVKFLKASDYNFTGTKSDLVLDMCRQLGADTYIFGAQGRDYAECSKFEHAGIKVLFQDYKHPQYSQFGGEFQSHLSIIDLLFHHGPTSKEILLNARTRQTIA